MLYILDLIGTFAFAAYGTNLAQRKSFDIFGIVVCALLSAFGGGTIRDLLLNRMPVYFTDITYILVTLLGVIFAIVAYRYFSVMQKPLLVIDAVGLVTFAFLGAHAADQEGLNIVGIILLATLTAVGGGVLRDISVREVPLVFYHDLYATPAILLGALYGVLRPEPGDWAAIYALLLGAFIFRICAIRFNWQLWKPHVAHKV